jgi:chemotaxis protein methyltransferase CheR
LRELALSDTNAYRRYLEETPSEWPHLDACCRISISRFYRDRAVFDALGEVVLPALALRIRERGGDTLRAWSVGCAAGEEPYTLALLWALALRDDWPELRLEILATDGDEHQLERAGRAVYRPSSLRGLPKPWLERAFEETPLGARLRESFRQSVRFELQDLRREMPDGPFDLVLCRNVAFTYFGTALQTRVGRRIARRIAPGGALVIGSHEELPGGLPLPPWPSCPGIYRVVGSESDRPAV